MNIPLSQSYHRSIDAERLESAEQVLLDHIRLGTTPAVCAAVMNRSDTLAVWAAGGHTYDADALTTKPDDLFDLASVTKVIATATLCGVYVDSGHLDLDQPVRDILTDCALDGRVTPRALLSHCSGLPAHVHLYKQLIDKREVEDAVKSMALEYEPLTRAVYSDMGYILLGCVLEAVGGAPLNELFRDHIREPLRVYETVFCPSVENQSRIVPTEDDRQWRGRLVHGEVHDENAAVMGGVAPHAGLFSTVVNTAAYTRLWLNEGSLYGQRILKPDTVKLFRTRVGFIPESTWALGWDTVSSSGSTSGNHFSPTSHGILGFTGTSIWVDPEADLAVVLLTNRVHPTRDNWGIRGLRPAFHDAVRKALLD